MTPSKGGLGRGRVSVGASPGFGPARTRLPCGQLSIEQVGELLHAADRRREAIDGIPQLLAQLNTHVSRLCERWRTRQRADAEPMARTARAGLENALALV
eukprot:3018758-Prymnesium_polylepis.1